MNWIDAFSELSRAWTAGFSLNVPIRGISAISVPGSLCLIDSEAPQALPGAVSTCTDLAIVNAPLAWLGAPFFFVVGCVAVLILVGVGYVLLWRQARQQTSE